MIDSRFDHSWGLGLDLVAFEQRKSKVLQKTDLPQTPQALLGFAYTKNPGNWCGCMPVFYCFFYSICIFYISYLYLSISLYCIYSYVYVFQESLYFIYVFILSMRHDLIFVWWCQHSLTLYICNRLCMAVMAFNLQQRETLIDYWRNHRLNRNHDIVHVRTSNMCTT